MLHHDWTIYRCYQASDIVWCLFNGLFTNFCLCTFPDLRGSTFLASIQPRISGTNKKKRIFKHLWSLSFQAIAFHFSLVFIASKDPPQPASTRKTLHHLSYNAWLVMAILWKKTHSHWILMEIHRNDVCQHCVFFFRQGLSLRSVSSARMIRCSNAGPSCALSNFCVGPQFGALDYEC